ncbi:hypothetical protein JOC86_003610 [Bacillus pakistanensis]|uniref:Uncharacterized protein n=1 Tax=Rossellomorea pakistanensis TaxID=992288 RepID=A0ABS2NGW3_9BACI|nr:hypothetical protein [Bacillus pakistanensis]MBM7587058.1 hypothetical protein [Bacillus pakistanensis]
MDDPSSKKVSKIYRKLVTSNEVKAYLIYERLNDEMKAKLREKLKENQSASSQHLLKLIDQDYMATSMNKDIAVTKVDSL